MLGGNLAASWLGGSEHTVRAEVYQCHALRFSDNKLKLDNPHLKQSSQRDFVQRLSVLFLHAYELKGREAVPRSELDEVLTDAKVYDGNARTWIAKSDLLSRDGHLIGLNAPGRERAKEVLRQVFDSNFETKWTFGSGSRVRAGKGNRKKEEEDAGQTGGAPSRGRRQKGTSYVAWVKKLIDEGFFKRERTGQDVVVELERRGHKFTLGRINDALVRSTKTDVLSRDKNASGDWVYQNK